jgi:predicted AAA+ superfamily ATPase
MFKRTLSPVLQRFATNYPIIGITGPRQSGKTTLSKMLFSHLPYVSLENLDTRSLAQADPRAFLKNYTTGAIFDEVQHVPELLSFLQGIVDESPETGRYILTGSQNFSLNQHISQSLSGRIGMATLLPLSLSEVNSPEDITLQIYKGGYPRPQSLRMDPMDFYPSYIQTYLERDVRQLKNIESLGKFQTFLRLCAGRVGQIVNFSSLAQDCGISHTTARQWLTILEASYLIFFLQPFHQNFNKRLIKMPKLYFYDTGLACSLLGLEKATQLETHYLKGALYENLAILEILKGRINQGKPPHIYFWRDHTGHEVDCIAEWGGYVKAIEIKSGSTFQSDFIKNLQYFENLLPSSERILIYNGNQEGQFLNTTLINIKKINQLFES